MPIDGAKEKLALERLTAGQLVDRYAAVHGEPTRSRNRVYLVRKILWKLQARELGELGSAARARAVELARGAELRTTLPPQGPPAGGASHRVLDPRVPRPGTTLTRLYKGRRHAVAVRADGFEYDGEWFPSLSAVARRITGSHCNGFRFFQLGRDA